MNWAAIGGEISSLFIRSVEQPEQIVREFGRHIVHVHPNRRTKRIITSIDTFLLSLRDQIVEHLHVLLCSIPSNCVVSGGGERVIDVRVSSCVELERWGRSRCDDIEKDGEEDEGESEENERRSPRFSSGGGRVVVSSGHIPVGQWHLTVEQGIFSSAEFGLLDYRKDSDF
ncbi:integral membrane sensor signal transductionhistidine kinase [Striga asiatica]|uniref:Integral membrane sensor signal transductionhistidine kinase n=1 Tax=Striga asiatica TaxID=4170 RepID=A0A5A7QS82_STRAF|nr:integral membrane sensor signal transductionhistidine kinase [Striga asiatica]